MAGLDMGGGATPSKLALPRMREIGQGVAVEHRQESRECFTQNAATTGMHG
jgi:hypothetical protein